MSERAAVQEPRALAELEPQAGRRGASAAAARAGLYAGHEVKEEPEMALEDTEHACLKREPTSITQEPGTVKLESVMETELVIIKLEPSDCDAMDMENATIKEKPTTIIQELITIEIERITTEPELVTIKQELPQSDETSSESPDVDCGLEEMLDTEPCPAELESVLKDDESPSTITCDKQRKPHQKISSSVKAKTVKGYTIKKQFPCDVCKKQFLQMCALRRHKKIHTEEKPYSCKTCNKLFVDMSNLKRHELGHAREKPYTCGYCKKQFADSSYIKRHERIHTGEKPYACQICKKQFSHGSELKRHERIHTGEKPYTCETCKKQFAHGADLKRHNRTHTGEKPYGCDICKKQFTESSKLKRHKLNHVADAV